LPGIVYTACYMTSDITCGNIAQCAQVDNGKKRTAAFGYILVQKLYRYRCEECNQCTNISKILKTTTIAVY
jgi:hypothetical protein